MSVAITVLKLILLVIHSVEDTTLHTVVYQLFQSERGVHMHSKP